jgi:hypothetical protein
VALCPRLQLGRALFAAVELTGVVARCGLVLRESNNLSCSDVEINNLSCSDVRTGPLEEQIGCITNEERTDRLLARANAHVTFCGRACTFAEGQGRARTSRKTRARKCGAGGMRIISFDYPQRMHTERLVTMGVGRQNT